MPASSTMGFQRSDEVYATHTYVGHLWGIRPSYKWCPRQPIVAQRFNCHEVAPLWFYSSDSRIVIQAVKAVLTSFDCGCQRHRRNIEDTQSRYQALPAAFGTKFSVGMSWIQDHDSGAVHQQTLVYLKIGAVNWNLERYVEINYLFGGWISPLSPITLPLQACHQAFLQIEYPYYLDRHKRGRPPIGLVITYGIKPDIDWAKISFENG